MNNNINNQSSETTKREVSDVVYKELSRYLFDEVNFISFPFTRAAEQSPWVTDTVNFVGASRLIDTAEGRFLQIGKQSRMKCNFYVRNAPNVDGYILSPVAYDSFAATNSFPSMNIFRSYVGIKINRGVVTVCVRQNGGPEENYPTNFTITDTGESTTYKLEIIYYGSYSEVYIDNKLIGTYQTFFGTRRQVTYLPLFSPVRSVNGTGVNITIENYQFIQDR